MSEHKLKSRLEVYGQFWTYCRSAIKCWFVDIGAKDVPPEGGERWAVVGRAVLNSFPSSLSLTEYITLISFSLSPLKSESTETVHGTVWPSQFEAKHKVLAKRLLLLCLYHQCLRLREEFGPTFSLLLLQGLFLQECKCSQPTFAAKSQPCRNLWRRNTAPLLSHFASVRRSCCSFPLWPVPWSLQVFADGHFPVKLVVC